MLNGCIRCSFNKKGCFGVQTLVWQSKLWTPFHYLSLLQNILQRPFSRGEFELIAPFL